MENRGPYFLYVDTGGQFRKDKVLKRRTPRDNNRCNKGFRWSLLGEGFPLRADALVASVLIGALLLASGIWYFRRTERSFADVI